MPSRPPTGKTVAIYVLSDPETGEVRYVGKTKNPSKRLSSHRWPSSRHHTPVSAWLRSLRDRSAVPGMRVVEWCRECEWERRERLAIERHRRAGARLLNVAAGGLDMAHVKKDRQRRPGFAWAMRFCARTGHRHLAHVIREAASLAAERGPSEVARFDRELVEGILEARPLARVV